MYYQSLLLQSYDETSCDATHCRLSKCVVVIVILIQCVSVMKVYKALMKGVSTIFYSLFVCKAIITIIIISFVTCSFCWHHRNYDVQYIHEVHNDIHSHNTHFGIALLTVMWLHVQYIYMYMYMYIISCTSVDISTCKVHVNVLIIHTLAITFDCLQVHVQYSTYTCIF